MLAALAAAARDIMPFYAYFHADVSPLYAAPPMPPCYAFLLIAADIIYALLMPLMRSVADYFLFSLRHFLLA